MQKLRHNLPAIFTGRLLAFLISFFVGISIANSQIIYTDVIPDSTIGTLDLNNDGSSDFNFYGSSWFGHCGAEISATFINSYVSPESGNQIANSGVYPSALSEWKIIDSTLTWSGASNQILISTGCFSSGKWNDTNDHYLGLKIVSGGNTYYGWARLSLTFLYAVTIKDYAYNSIPDQQILAGESPCVKPDISLTGITLTTSASDASYQWIDCETGNYIEGAFEYNYTPAISGSYACIVTTDDCTISTDCETVTIADTTTNVYANIFNHSIFISPNPANAKLKIDLPFTSASQILITNLLGEIIYSENLNSIENELDISEFKDGVYLITISNSSLKYYSKFIKQ